MNSVLGPRVASATASPTLRGLPPASADGVGAMRRSALGAQPAVADRAGRPVIGSRHVMLDLVGLEAAGVIAPATSRSDMAENFRRIKLPLVMNARDHAGASPRRSTIMVSSAVSGEGKTFCAINLALSLAGEIDSRVLLVDADAEHPALMHRLRAPSDLGLFDLLTHADLQLADVVLQTNVPRLDLLPAGTPHVLPGEVLASDAMQRMLEALAAEPDRIVVFDTSALLTSAVPHVLAAQVGQIVLVIETSVTPRQQVLQALSSIDHCDLVMPLLNRGPRPRAARRGAPTTPRG